MPLSGGSSRPHRARGEHSTGMTGPSAAHISETQGLGHLADNTALAPPQEAVMGMMNRMRPPQPSGRAPQASQQYTGPMQGRQSFGWTPARPAGSQQMAPGVTSGMAGRQAFGWTPVGQMPAQQGGQQRSNQYHKDPVVNAMLGAYHRQFPQGGLPGVSRTRSDTRSDELTHTGAKPRDRYNPFDNSPTRPEANPRRGK